MCLASTLTTMETPCTGTRDTSRKPRASTGTSITLLFAPLFVVISLLPLVSSWSAAAMPLCQRMVEDGYENIMNIDISSVAIDIMRRKYEHVHQLNYMEMDARDMSFFPDKSFDAAVDKGTLDSLMCGSDDHISSVRMLREVSRILKPGGIYMLITYGDPKVRMPHLTQSIYNWKIVLYIIPRPGFEKPAGSSSNPQPEPVPISDTGLLPADFVLEDPDSHFIYVCKKMDETTEVSDISSNPLIADAL
ncbi:EEF1A lysine methyltransferase [Salix suchowensis]|nr:EEF1A lysine methyltransferase [Salix suchowensis]